MSYFESFVNASMRKDVLKDIPSEHGDSLFKGDDTAINTFKHFDKNGDEKLDKDEFSKLLEDLFRDAHGNPHPVDHDKANQMFSIFNKNGGEGITMQDFQRCWECWIKPILRPVSAIVIVDVQNDFISGTLSIKELPAKQDGEDVVPVINDMLNSVPFDNIFYSQDWHPTDHISFHDNLNLPGREFAEDSPIQNKDDAKLFSNVIFRGPPKTNQTLWPRHCVQETDGAAFHKDLDIHPVGINIQKGTDSNIDSYSAFFDNGKLAKTELDAKLKERGVTDVYTCGIATDICVSYTSNDAQDLGYRTVLIENASGGVNPDDIARTKMSIRSKHGLVVDSASVKDLVQGRNRPVELGYMKALQCKI